MTRKNAYSYDELLAAGRGELFGPESARLPLPNMLMFDRINEITEGAGAYQSGIVRAELDIKPELWFFGCHFQGDPVMPGCLGLDSLWQLTGFFSYTIDIKRVINRKLVLAIADGKVAVDGKEVYTADSLKVGLFESTDGF